MAIATPDDLSSYLGHEVDENRAALFISLAEAQCEAYISPLPQAALGIVLKVAAQAMTNPVSTQTETAGPFSYGVANPYSTGVSLTKADVRQLRLLANRGSVFSIDPTPEDAGTGLMPWGQNVLWLDGVPLASDNEVQGGGV